MSKLVHLAIQDSIEKIHLIVPQIKQSEAFIQKCIETLNQIHNQNSNSLQMAENVVTLTNKQDIAMKNIVDKLNFIVALSTDTSKSLQDSNEIMEELADISNTLQSDINFFKL